MRTNRALKLIHKISGEGEKWKGTDLSVQSAEVEVFDAAVDEASDVDKAKKELVKSLNTKASHMIRDLGKDEISIATGGEKSIRVKILGYAK